MAEGVTGTRGLTDLTSREVGVLPGEGGGQAGAAPGRRVRGSSRRWWFVAFAGAVAWSLWSAGVGRRELVNPGGWTLVGRFWRAALDPELSGPFLGITWRATLTTVAFAVLGTALSVVIGVVGGVFSSETWWRRPRPAGLRGPNARSGLRGPNARSGLRGPNARSGLRGPNARSGLRGPNARSGLRGPNARSGLRGPNARSGLRGPNARSGLRPGWFVGRGLLGLPRGVHEAVWGLFLVNVLGRDPMVGVLAIAIPFGAITAKVYAELIDESAQGPYEALRAAGAGRVAALAYGVFPRILPDMVSYAFYRLECSIRSAVILGMIGAGGLGFELNLTFQSLRYREMWTLIYALVAISALADFWGATLRRRGTVQRVRRSLLGGLVLLVAAFVHLGPDLGRLFSAATRVLLADVAGASWPPSLPADGWGGLVQRAVDTVAMSLLAIAIAAALAVGAAFLAARGGGSPLRRLAAGAARLLLLVTRAVPPPVWALLVLFVLFPGPLPGAVALGIYNFGILGRLMAEVVENLDPRPGAALREGGAGGVATFAYATLPLSSARFAAYSLYRWEVALRETVVVGVVGAGGLGRLLEQQRAAFDYPGMLATVLALIVVSVAVDLVSAWARRSLR